MDSTEAGPRRLVLVGWLFVGAIAVVLLLRWGGGSPTNEVRERDAASAANTPPVADIEPARPASSSSEAAPVAVEAAPSVAAAGESTTNTFVIQLSGRLLDAATEQPIVAARITAMGRTRSETISDQNGRFRLAVDSPLRPARGAGSTGGTGSATLEVVSGEPLILLASPLTQRSPQLMPSGSRFRIFGLTGDADLGDLSFERGVLITGVVLDAEGMPAPDARVSAVAAGGFGAASAQSDSRGEFSLHAPRAPSYTVQARKGLGMLRTTASPEEGESKIHLLLRLEPAGGIAGRVFGVDGEPARGASVRIHGMANSSYGVATDKDAGFRYSPLPAGHYWVSGSLDDDQTIGSERVSVEVRDGEFTEGVEIRLNELNLFEGIVIDGDGNPLEAVEITLRNGPLNSQRTLTKQDGTFVLGFPGRRVVEQITAFHPVHGSNSVENVDIASQPLTITL